MISFIKRTAQSWAAWIYRHYISEHVRRELYHNDIMTYRVFGGEVSRVRVAPTAGVLGAFCNVSSGTITVEDYASVSYGALLITGSHDISMFDVERQISFPQSGRDIVVRRGAWVCSGAIVLGPCVIGEQAVVAAGAVVTQDVPAHSVVAGVPARVIKKLGDQVSCEAVVSPKEAK